MNDEFFMQAAIAEAKRAYELGEVPVGAVLVRNGEIIASAHNLRETEKNATAHAELICIDSACKKLGGWRIPDATLYVTLEPCPMCAGAIINARVDRVVFGAYDKRFGACGSLLDLTSFPFNHRPEMTGGVLQSECSALLKTFFAKLRK